MRILSGEQVLVRVFIGESDKWHHQSLPTALLERLCREHFAGATMFHGVAGFGARSILHTTRILRLSEDLPVVIEIVDSEDRMEQLTAILDEDGHGSGRTGHDGEGADVEIRAWLPCRKDLCPREFIEASALEGSPLLWGFLRDRAWPRST